VRALCLHNPSVADVKTHIASGQFFWIDLQDPSDDELHAIGQLLKLHPLTIQDAQTFHQNPKFEEFEGYVYMVAYGVDPEVRSGDPLLHETHLVVSGEYVMTVHLGTVRSLAELLERSAELELRSELQLVYRILDALAGTFFPVLARIDDDIDSIEDDVLENPDQRSLQRIFSLKRDLVAMRRVVTPLRDVYARNVERIGELPGMQGDGQVYFRDLYDTMIRVSDLVDSYRDLLSGATDLYLATVANRQGEVNKQLTIIATIFLPLTFLTGFFGQNFVFLVKHIVSAWSFFVFGVGLLILAMVVPIVYFKRKRWM
jgi:magnesium transporter